MEGETLEEISNEQTDLNLNKTVVKKCDSSCSRDTDGPWYESNRPSSSVSFPNSIADRNTVDRSCDSSVPWNCLVDCEERTNEYFIKQHRRHVASKHKKRMKSGNLRVCFAAMSEELINLDDHWKKVEEMIVTYEKLRDETAKDVQQCKRDMHSLKEKETELLHT